MGDRVAVMKRGVLQQVDDPQVLYDRPVNLFVAGFIGSPAMNMVQATLTEDADALVLTVGDQQLAVADELVAGRPALRSYVGRDIVLGVRPEDMEDAALVDAAPTGRRLRATVDLVERMGSEAYLHFTLGAPPVVTDDTRELAEDIGLVGPEELDRHVEREHAALVARVGPRTRAAKGQPVELVVDTSHLHVFDPDTGLAVSDGMPPAPERESQQNPQPIGGK